MNFEYFPFECAFVLAFFPFLRRIENGEIIHLLLFSILVFCLSVCIYPPRRKPIQHSIACESEERKEDRKQNNANEKCGKLVVVSYHVGVIHSAME